MNQPTLEVCIPGYQPTSRLEESLKHFGKCLVLLTLFGGLVAATVYGGMTAGHLAHHSQNGLAALTGGATAVAGLLALTTANKFAYETDSHRRVAKFLASI